MYDEREIFIYSAFPFVKKKFHKKEIGISIQSLLLKLNMSSVLNMLNDANYVRQDKMFRKEDIIAKWVRANVGIYFLTREIECHVTAKLK